LAALAGFAEGLLAAFAGAFTTALAPAETGDFAGAALVALWAAAAGELAGRGAFFATTDLAAWVRADSSDGMPAFFAGSPAAFVTAGFAGALETFAFTTAPFFVSAATWDLGTIGLSCRGEGDRR
jgi:hypothetical protein